MNMILNRKILLYVVLVFFMGVQHGFSQDVKVQGLVVSMKDGKPLSEITIKIVNNTVEPALTDSAGHFSILVPNLNVLLEFSFPGRKTVTIALNKRDSLVVQMGLDSDYWYEDQISLPSGMISNKYFSGSKSFINKGELEQTFASSIESKIVGQAAGVRVIDYSGAPGAGSSVTIRGASSINGGTQPLYVVDGLVLRNYQFDNPLALGAHHNPLADLNPDDIHSITILKDGASASLYGVRGANGVVMIETNKGTSGKTKLSFDAYWGLAQMNQQYSLLNKSQFKTYYKDLRYKEGLSINEFADQYGAYFYEDKDGVDYYRYNNDVNWQDKVTQLGQLQSYHLNLQGGDQITTYAFSTGYFKQDGIVSGTDFTRFSIDFNLLYRVSSKIRFGNVVNFSYSKKNLMDEGINPYSNPLFAGLVKAPFLAPNIYSSDGIQLATKEDQDFFNISNPASITGDLKNEAGFNRFIGNLYLEMDLYKDLMARLSMAVDYSRQTEKRFYPDYGIVSISNADRYSEGKTHNSFMIQTSGVLSYHKTINYIHKLKASGGIEYMTQKINYTYGKSINSAADYFTTLSKGEADSIASDNRQSVLGSLYGNVEYALKDRYLLNLNVRMDGSSRFGENNRYGLFYGVSGAWRIASESFLQDVSFINELKLKAGYGKSGNENIDDFAAYTLYGGGAYNLRGATMPISLGNPDLKWETTNQIDFGVEFLGFNARFGLDVDFYLKKTQDLFYVKELPSITGYSGVLSNLGDLENRGIDLTIFGLILNKCLIWDSKLNVGSYKNKVTRLPDGDYKTSYMQFTGLAREGEPLGVLYGYETNGIYDNDASVKLINSEGHAPFQAGDLIFKDYKSDGIINSKDMVVIGDPNPDFFGGWLNSLKYKQFFLDLNLTFSYGNDVVNTTRSQLESMSGDYNQTIAVLRAWQNTGDASSTNIPRIAYGDPAGNNRNSSRWVEDASFLRIQSATLSYNFGKNVLTNTLFKSINIYVKGQNLYTWSNYLGYNPDLSSGYNPLLMGIDVGAYPVPRTFLIGVKFGL